MLPVSEIQSPTEHRDLSHPPAVSDPWLFQIDKMHQLAMVYDEQQASLNGVLKDALVRRGYRFDEYDDGGVEGIDAGIYFYRPSLPTPMHVPMSQDGALFVSVDVFSCPAAIDSSVVPKNKVGRLLFEPISRLRN